MNTIAKKQLVTNIAISITRFLNIDQNLKDRILEIIELHLEHATNEFRLNSFKAVIEFCGSDITPEELQEYISICMNSEEFLESYKKLINDLFEELKNTAITIKSQSNE